MLKTILSLVILLGILLPEIVRASDQPADKAAESPKPKQAAIRLEYKQFKIAGTLDLPVGDGPFPVVIFIVGSGPTDRDGNTVRMGYKHSCLQQLGQALAEKGIAVLRYDRPGVGESPLPDGFKEDDYRFEMLVEDVVEWVKLLRKDSRFTRIGIVGHSQGSLVGMLAAKQAGADAFVSIAGVGRPTGELLRWQFDKNLPSKSLKEKGGHMIDEFIAGRTVTEIPKGLEDLRLSVQPFLISLFKYDPAKEIAKLEIPVLIVAGTTDIQVPVDDARLLAAAKPDAQLCVIEGMNHVLKKMPFTMKLIQLAAYKDPVYPLAPGLVDEISGFLRKSLARR